MDTYYFDWAHGKINVLMNDDEDDVVLGSLDELLDLINEPSRIIGEATFESFFRDSKRNDIIDRCEEEGHILLTTPNRATGRWKVKKYPPDNPEYKHFYENNARFPDNLAVALIRDIAKAGCHLKVPRKFDPDDPWLPLRQAASKDIMVLRNTKHTVTGPRGGEKLVSDQERLADQMLPFLVPYKQLPERQSRSLGNGKEYSKTLVATTAVASKYVSNVKEFDKLSGLYAHGYPSQFRSNYHYYGMKTAIKRHGDTKEVRKDFRYSCRWLYHQLKGLFA